MRNSPIPQTPVLSTTADYALRAVLVLARSDGKRLSVDEIARATGAPRNYLGKTLNVLAKTGIVTSVRGPLGGFGLAIPAEALTVARVADAFAEAPRARNCLLGSRACDLARPCTAHSRWSAIAQSARDALVNTRIADLLSATPA